MKKTVGVFGSATIGPDTVEYGEAVEIGRIIGRLGFDLLCGGYGGVMEAVARGCNEAGGRGRGIGLERFSPTPNPYIHRFERSRTLGERLDYFDRNADIFLGLTGGIGTVTEIMFFWDQAKGGALQDRPILVYGEQWRGFIDVLRNYFIIPDAAFDLITPVNSLENLQNCLHKFSSRK